jgi:hypothetical protein
MKWARYLGATFGTTGALRALQYYREINWISDSVKRTMTEYVRGLPIEDLDRQPDSDLSLTDALSSLEGTHFEEHAKSLEFIAAIADNNIEHSLASLQLTENGSMGMAGTGSDLADQSADLFTAPGFDGADGTPGEAIGDPATDSPKRTRDSTGTDGHGPERRSNPHTDRGGVDASRPSSTEPASSDLEPERPDSRPADPTPDRSAPGSDADDVASPPPGGRSGVTTAERRSSDGTGSEGRSVDGTGSEGRSAGQTAADSRPSPSTGSDAREEPPDSIPNAESDAGVDPDAGTEPNTDVESRAEEPSATGSSNPAESASANESPASPTENDDTSSEGDTANPDDEVPPDEDRCIALTRDGERCSRRAMDGSDYCKQHAP